MKIQLTEELSKLSNINANVLNKFEALIEKCIIDSIYQAKINDEDIIELETTFGALLIKIEGANVKFKFVPTKHLVNELNAQLGQQQSLFENTLKDAVVKRFNETFKDLL